MSGQMLHRAHRCDPPAEATRGSRWRCDCGRTWRCTDDTIRFSSGSFAFGATWDRGWWDLLGSRRGTS